MSNSRYRPIRLTLRMAALASLSLVLAACREEAPVARTPSLPAAATPPAEVVPALAAGMPAAQAEALLIEAGWLPLRDREACLDNTGDAAGLCRTAFALHACAEGACALQYAHADAGRTLRLNVAAPAAEAEVLGAVRDWTSAALPAQNAVPACPAADFDGFLRAYAADASVRAAFTAPLVRVTESVDREEAGYVDVQTLELGARYTGFSLTLHDGGFHVVDSAGGVSPTPVAPEVRSESDGAYFVVLSGNVEGLSYRFERAGDCWRLTQDPEPAAP